MFAKLFDFGIARIQSQVAVTQANAGPPSTYAYGAPEIHLRSEYLSPAIDVYALGVTLFEMITKQRPFSGTGLDVVWAHMKSAPRTLGECRKDVKIPSRLDRLVAQMLEKDPEQRPTMAQVAERLEALQTPLRASSSRGVHSLRTYVLPNKQSERPSHGPAGPAASAPAAPPTALQEIVAIRDLDQIETEREQLSAQLENECASIIKLYLAQDLPADIKELLRRCQELATAKNELDLLPLQEQLAQEKTALRTTRQALRQRLQTRRDEVRSLTLEGRAVPAAVTQDLELLERAYAAPAPPSAIAERVQQEGIRQQQLRAELIDTQTALAEGLLRALIAKPTKPTGRPDTARKMVANRLTEVLSQLAGLNESLKKI